MGIFTGKASTGFPSVSVLLGCWEQGAELGQVTALCPASPCLIFQMLLINKLRRQNCSPSVQKTSKFGAQELYFWSRGGPLL